ncbi:hypothetical protein ACFXKE_16300 [Streptomyces sp. NPDC059202]|uniref:hypothetical protein n=1 Tax=unclassified Streptomyces TaxID=2593676 RepID=UPI003654997A
MVEELAEVVVKAAGWTARGVASVLSVPEVYGAAVEVLAQGDERPRKRGRGRKDSVKAGGAAASQD